MRGGRLGSVEMESSRWLRMHVSWGRRGAGRTDDLEVIEVLPLGEERKAPDDHGAQRVEHHPMRRRHRLRSHPKCGQELHVRSEEVARA
eukprot:58022-Rhodomonas_salina.1